MARDSRVYLHDMSQAGRRAIRFACGCSWEQFAQDDQLAAAVERQIEIIGEALRSLLHHHPQWKASFPDASRIIGMRNILIHGYDQVDRRIVWDVLCKYLPDLVERVEKIGEQGSDDPQ